MTVALASLAISMFVQIAGVVWWASRMSHQIEAITSSLKDARVELSAMRGEVQAHDTQFAILRALDDAAKRAGRVA